MEFLKKRLTLVNVVILALLIVAILYYFLFDYSELIMVRDHLGMGNRTIGISAFAMTFGNSDWDIEYIRNIWPIFLLIIPILAIGFLFVCKKWARIVNVILALLGIVFIIQGYMHMANLYNGTYGPLGEEFTFVINVKGILYIIVYALLAICSGLELFIQRKNDVR